MGLESANFVFLPKKKPAAGWKDFFREQGAECRTAGLSGFPEFVFRSDTHWIDLQVIQKDMGPEKISVRVALCNPDDAVRTLIDLLQKLVEAFGGVVVDENTSARLRGWDQKTASIVVESFRRQQKRFQKSFGNWKAAIPAEQVFDVVRQRKQAEDSARGAE